MNKTVLTFDCTDKILNCNHLNVNITHCMTSGLWCASLVIKAINLGFVYTGLNGTVRNRTGPDRLVFTWNRLEPIQVFTLADRTVCNRSVTDPNGSKTGSPTQQFQFWIRLDPCRTGSRTVTCKQNAYPIRSSDRISLEPVPCKASFSI